MAKRLKIGSGSPWEDIVGYSRTIRIGNIIEVPGTTAMDGDVFIGEIIFIHKHNIFLKKLKKRFLLWVVL